MFVVPFASPAIAPQQGR